MDGIEFRASWAISDRDLIGLRYAETDGRYDANGDNRVDSDLDGANIAPDRINLSWDRHWSDRIATRLQVNRLADREFDNAAGVTTAEFDGYATVDLSADIAALGGRMAPVPHQKH